MKRAHRIVVFVAVGVGLATLVAAGVVFAPIVVESMYLHDLASPDEARRRAAAQVLGSIGSRRAVPLLIDLLPERRSDHRQDPDHHAHRALVRIGAPAVGPLVDRLDGAIDEHDVVHVLVEIGPPAIPTLAEKLRRGTRNARRAAAWILAQIGEPSPHLVALLEEADPEFGANRETLPSRIASDLGHADASTRGRAVFALGGLARPASFLPQLLEALDDPSHYVRCSAAGVLGRLGGAAREAIPRLARNLDRCTHHDEFSSTVEALRSIGAGAEAVPTIARVMRGELFADLDPSVRESAAAMLGSLGSASADATGALVAALEDPWPRVRFRAVHALALLGAVDGIPALIELLARAETRGDLQISAEIIAAFEKMDIARAALPLLEEIAKDEEAPAQDLARSLVERWARESEQHLQKRRRS